MCTKQKERDAGDEDTESNRERGNEIKREGMKTRKKKQEEREAMKTR